MTSEIRIKLQGNGNLIDITQEGDAIYQGAIAVSEYHLIAEDWLATSVVYMTITRPDGQTGKWTMDRVGDEWVKTTEGWETDVEITEATPFTVAFEARVYSTVDLTSYVLKRPSTNISLMMYPSAGWIPANIVAQSETDLAEHIADDIIHITAEERSYWNAKSEFSGSYTDLENKPTIPTLTSDLTNDSDFVVDEDYVHTDNNFDDDKQSKLAGVDEGAQVNILEAVKNYLGTPLTITNKAVTINKTAVGLSNVDNTSDLNKPISTATQSALDLKVDVEEGKGLSTNDFTTAEQSKLSGIDAGAEVNVIEVIKDSEGTPLEITNKTITLPASSGGLELGETSETAYRGDRGKTAYDHSQATGNQHSTASTDLTDTENIARLNATQTFSAKQTINKGTGEQTLLELSNGTGKTLFKISNLNTPQIDFASGYGIIQLAGVNKYGFASTEFRQSGDVTSGTLNLGTSSNRWKDLYLAGKIVTPTINNGADIDVPNTTGTIVTTTATQTLTNKSIVASQLTGDIAGARMSANAVVLTGNQTVAGVKTFSDDMITKGGLRLTVDSSEGSYDGFPCFKGETYSIFGFGNLASYGMVLDFANVFYKALIPFPTETIDIGKSNNKFKCCYLQKLNNGANIDIPTSAGTMITTTNLLTYVYPVGSIYTSVVNTSPASFLGGTWAAFGAGRVLLGMGDNGETNYTSVEATGGSEDSVAVHSHAVRHIASGGDALSLSAGGSNYRLNFVSPKDGSEDYNLTAINSGTAGGNRMPYITVYMWKRVEDD